MSDLLGFYADLMIAQGYMRRSTNNSDHSDQCENHEHDLCTDPDCGCRCHRATPAPPPPICPECREARADDDRVRAGMKCGPCAYGGTYAEDY